MTKFNDFLAISIPIYEDSKLVSLLLDNLIPQVSQYNIPIYLYDNSISDVNCDMVIKRKMDYQNIIYVKNKCNIGAVDNVIKSLVEPEAEYVFLMSVATILKDGTIQSLIASLELNKPDFLCYNYSNRTDNKIVSQVFSNHVEVSNKIGWHLTHISTCIWSRRVLEISNFNRYKVSLFPHLGCLLEFIGLNNFSLVWIADELAVKNKCHRVSSWQSEVLNTWCDKWPNFVFSLPSTYGINDKLNLIKQHNRKSDLFSKRSILMMRSNNVLNLKQVLEVRWKILFAKNILFIISIIITPRFLINKPIKIGRVVLRKLRKSIL